MRKVKEKRLKDGIRLKDEIKGIEGIWEIYRTPEVRIFTIEVTTKLKGCGPAWRGSCIGTKKQSSHLVWLDPAWTPRQKRIKETSIFFGRELEGYTPIIQMSRYTCFVAFFRKVLLEKAVETKEAIFYKFWG